MFHVEQFGYLVPGIEMINADIRAVIKIDLLICINNIIIKHMNMRSVSINMHITYFIQLKNRFWAVL